jgi:hypothetical protein
MKAEMAHWQTKVDNLSSECMKEKEVSLNEIQNWNFLHSWRAKCIFNITMSQKLMSGKLRNYQVY